MSPWHMSSVWSVQFLTQNDLGLSMSCLTSRPGSMTSCLLSVQNRMTEGGHWPPPPPRYRAQSALSMVTEGQLYSLLWWWAQWIKDELVCQPSWWEQTELNFGSAHLADGAYNGDDDGGDGMARPPSRNFYRTATWTWSHVTGRRRWKRWRRPMCIEKERDGKLE